VTPRERIWMALNHREPDRVPIDMGSWTSSIHIGAYKRLRNYLGIKEGKIEISDVMQQIVKIEENILERFHVDTRNIFLKPAQPWRKCSKGIYRDEWGIKYTKSANNNYYDMIEYPLAHATVKELDDYPWPDPYDPRRVEGLEKEAKKLYEDTPYAIVLSGFSESLFGLPSWLRGPTQFYMDLVSNKEFVNALLDRILNYWKSLANITLQIVGKYIQVVKLADDLGMQRGPIISPKLYRKLIKPRQRELYTFIKKRTKAKILLHSCGSVYNLIPDFIEIGVDALNPIQVSAKDMDTKRLKREFGNKLTFWGGGCDTQHILPQGTPNQVREEVRRRIEDLAPKGGFIFTPVHNIQYDVSPENICALYDAALEFGKYFLSDS